MKKQIKKQKTVARKKPMPVQAVAVDWLKAYTGKDNVYWVRTVQELIQKHSRKTKDPWHDTTDANRWVKDLTNVVAKTAPKKRHDENMRMAAVLGMVLVLWYTRVHRAKTYDSRRPVRLRQDAYGVYQTFVGSMLRNMTDESRDPIHFPGQPWETPFHPYPTDGVFV